MLKMQELYTVLTTVRRKSKDSLTVTIQVTNKRSGSSKTAVLAFSLKELEGDVNTINNDDSEDIGGAK